MERNEREQLSTQRTFTRVQPAAVHAWAERFEAACLRPGATNIARPRGERRRFPDVPDDEIPYFRAACRAALSARDFHVVDTAYHKAFGITTRWLRGRQSVRPDEAGAFLASRLRWVYDVNEQLTFLRGAQVAFLRRWWLLKVNPEALAAAQRIDPLIDLDDDEVYDRLRKYVQPKTSALAALAIATRLPPGRLAMLNADQAFDGHRRRQAYDTIDLGDEVLAVPGAHLFLRAHHLDRELREQPPDGPLFTTTTGKRLSPAGVQQQLPAVSRDTGLPLVAGWSASPAQHNRHWMHRRGLTLQAL